MDSKNTEPVEWLLFGEEHFNKRRLSCAAVTDDRDEFPRLHAEADIFESNRLICVYF
jgi:hypothetical protein